MMISRSDASITESNSYQSSGAAVRLLGAPRHSAKSVSLLQFDAIEMPLLKMLAEVDAALLEPVDEIATEAQTQSDLKRIAAEIESAHAAGRMEAQGELEDALKTQVAEERARVIQTCERFARERDGYFAAVEGEVVKLALAIATRVLHREVKLDPMLLQAVVKVALSKVAKETSVVLRVPLGDEQAWMTLIETEDTVVEVTGDSKLKVGECVLETSIGRVELGVGAQLEEIEKGFFDLLQQRPA